MILEQDGRLYEEKTSPTNLNALLKKNNNKKKELRMVKQTSTETLLGAFTVFLCLGMFLFNEMQGSACCHSPADWALQSSALKSAVQIK